jgi:hypothetical protein
MWRRKARGVCPRLIRRALLQSCVAGALSVNSVPFFVDGDVRSSSGAVPSLVHQNSMPGRQRRHWSLTRGYPLTTVPPLLPILQ